VSTAAPRLEPPQHLLVRLPNPLGDAVMATPALRALRQALPATRITWAGGPAAQSVLEGLTMRDDVMPLAEKDARGRRAPLRAGRILKSLGADAALLLPNSFSSALAVRRAGIGVRVGSDLHARRALLTTVVRLPKTEDGKLQPRSMVDHYLDLAAPFGAVADGRGTELATTAFDDERAARRLEDAPTAVPLIGINPGAAFADTKIYPPERIAAAVQAVGKQHPMWPVVLCGPGEEALAADVAGRLAGACTSCHDAPPDLGELKALLVRLTVLATTDAGPRHMAEALGTPTVVWMGPTDPRWSGHSAAQIVRREDLDCLACHRKVCPIGLPCMRELEPERVAQAILRLL
jgi:heptosyltransferase-2